VLAGYRFVILGNMSNVASRASSTVQRNIGASKALGKKMDRSGDRVVTGLRKAAKSSSSGQYANKRAR
jgi:hypothetical protein